MKHKFFTFFLALMASAGALFAQSGTCTIADIYNMAQDSAITLGAFDVVYVPTYQNGANMYIKDATGSCVIYKASYGLKAGDHVEAGLEGKITIYNGLYEIIPITTKDNLTITSGEAPAPIEATEVPSLTNVSQYVVYKNVSFSKDTAFVVNRRHAVPGVWNNQDIIFYNQYYIGASLKADKKYNIVAVNTVYNTTLEAYPLSVEEVGDGTPTPYITASGTCGAQGDNLTWELSCDGVLTISGTGAMDNYSYDNSKRIPLTPWNSYLSDIKSIVIKDGVTSIGDLAFYDCTSLSSIEIPNSVTSFGKYAFFECTSLNSINIPNSVTNIGERAFNLCYKLSSVNIPNSVTSIGDHAFSGCIALPLIEIPNSVTSIGDFAFSLCDNLTSIIVADDNPQYSSIDGVLFDKAKKKILRYPGGKTATSYAIPNSVTIIARAFSYCTNLTSIEIPSSVTSIGYCAFFQCTGLTSIEIPNSVTNIGIESFAYCTGLTSIEIPNSVTKIGDNAFSSCSSLTSIEIPNSVTSIGSYAFDGCTGLTSFEFPNSVTKIEWGTFSGCTGLTSVEISSSVTSIGQSVFASCSNLISVTNLATAPQTINANVFRDVTLSAATLYVPAESIEAYKAANVWKDFGTIKAIEGDTPTPCITASGTFGAQGDNLTWELSCDGVLTISGTGAMDVYKNKGWPWTTYKSSISSVVIKEGVTNIEDFSFHGCNSLISIEIPNSIVSIGNNVFYLCTNLTSIELPNSVTRIGDNAFFDCNALTSVKLGNSLTTIGSSAFENCFHLTSIEIPNSVISIGDNAFVDCESLESIIIPDGITKIEFQTFAGCSNLISVTIPNSVTSIGSMAFSACYSLNSIEIPSSVTSIEDNAFRYCRKLTSVTNYAIEPQLIGADVFYDINISSCALHVPAESLEAYKAADVWKDFGTIKAIGDTPTPCITASGTCGDNLTWELSCDGVLTISGTGKMTEYDYPDYGPWYSHSNGIKSAIIGDGVTSIGEWAFNSCRSLTSVTIPNSVTSIGGAAFGDCDALTSVTIPNSVTSIGEDAFAFSNSLISITVAEDNQNYCSPEGVLFNKDMTTLIQYPAGRTATSYIIPNSVASIRTNAFCYCRQLTSVDIPNSVTSIGVQAFYSCSGLTSVTIPNSVTSIGYSAFYNCSSLISIEIPSSVTSIGYWTFNSCRSLTIVTNNAIVPQTVNANIFGNVILSAATLYVPAESLEAYKAADVWKDFGNILPIEEPQGDITVAEAIAIGSALEIGQSTNEEYSVTGYVVNASPFNTQTKDQIWWMADDAENTGAQEFEAYACTVSENNVVMQVLNGDKVTLTGKITKYNDVQNDRTFIEIKNGTAVFVSKVEGKHSIYDTITVAQALEIGAELEAGQSTDKEYVIKGYSTVIQTAHDATYNTESFWIADEKGSKAASNANGAFFVYRGQPDTEKSVGIGALVYVTTKIQRYTDGVIESITKSAVHVEEQGEEEVIQSISVAQALEIGAQLADGAVTDARYEITGYVSNINTFYNADYGNETLWISDDPNSTAASRAEGAFEIYRGKPNTGAEVGYGAKVKIICKIKNYNGTIIENDVVNQPFEVLEESTFVPDTVSAEEAANIVASLSGETSQIYYVVKGFIQSISTPYSANSASFYLSDSKNDVSGAALAYKTAILKADAEKVVEGNYVSVMGYLMERNGVAQIAQGSITAFVEAPQRNKYIITFLNDDGSVVDQREWEEGTLPTCKEPTKEDNDYIYCFIGWNPEIDTVRATATYQAMYEVCGGWLAGDINWRIDHDSLIVSGNGVIPDYEQGAAPWLPYSSRINVIEVKEGITRIGEWAFADMTAKTVHIASSVTVMGANAYKGTSTIDKVVYDGYDYEWANINFVNEYSNPLFYGATFNYQVLHIYPTTTTISTSAFVGMSTIVYHGTVEQWCSMTFTSDYYPSYDLEIDDVIITDLCFGEGLEKISAHAFHGCRSIQRVCIPKSLKQIGQDAFKNMPSLKTVTYAGDLKQWCAITFANAEANPACHADFYFGDEKLGTRLDIPETVTTINAFAFPNINTLNVYFRSADPAGYELNSFGEPDLVGDKYFYVPCDAKEAYRVRLNYAENLFEEYYQYLYTVASADEKQGRVTILHEPTCEEPQLDIQALPNDGFRFVEWSDGNTEAQRSLTLYSDTALKARFDLDSVLIRFLLDDSTLVMEKMFKYGTMPECADPVKEPTAQYTFTFLRWEPEVTVALQDTTYIALFDSVVNSYMVYFINWNGVLLAEQEVEYGSAAVAPEVPAREGYKFVGWNVDINFIVGRTFAVALFEKEETGHGGFTIHYRNTVDDTEIAGETIDLHFPEPPTIEGFVFVGWQAVCDEFIVEGMEIMAVYEPVDPQSTEEVVVNPSNPAQKLFRNGNVYILKDDRTYTVQGQLVK